MPKGESFLCRKRDRDKCGKIRGRWACRKPNSEARKYTNVHSKYQQKPCIFGHEVVQGTKKFDKKVKNVYFVAQFWFHFSAILCNKAHKSWPKLNTTSSP